MLHAESNHGGSSGVIGRSPCVGLMPKEATQPELSIYALHKPFS